MVPTARESDLVNDFRLLTDIARRLAAQGETGDTVLASPHLGMPESLRTRLRAALGMPNPAGYRVVPGLLVGIEEPGLTPIHWREADGLETAVFDIALVLVAAVLGTVIGWPGQQDGRVVHNIVPSPGYEEMQVGAGSKVALEWHTEDAFHPGRADLLVLACVRNVDGVGSRLSTVNRLALADADLDQLARPGIVVLPDDSYEYSDTGVAPVGVSTVWHRDGKLGLRYDPAYSRILLSDPQFRAAYDNLGAALEAASFVVPLSRGDVLVIDNDVTVHSRAGFQPRYDGTDRWLKRVLVRSSRQRPARERLEHGFGQTPYEAARAAQPRHCPRHTLTHASAAQVLA